MGVRIRFAVLVAVSVAGGGAVAGDVETAVGKGAEYLKKLIAGKGGEEGIGPTALAGLALLEVGVPTDDPAVVAVTKSVRDAAFTENRTYQLALCLLYLDRFGEPGDRPLIQILGVRLLAGQNASGGWTYECVPDVPAATERELRNKFDTNRLVAERGKPVAAPKDAPSRPTTVGRLHNDVEKYRQGLLADQKIGKDHGDDNSNTQFGVLGVWVARRHGVPVEDALTRIEKRFLAAQTAAGGWPYSGSKGGEGSPSMTCAGLLGLAVAIARREERELAAKKLVPKKPAEPKVVGNPDDPFFNPPAKPDEPKKAEPEKPADATDRAIEKGMAHLADALDGRGGGKGNGKGGKGNMKELYFWWSVERVGVVYGANRIGGVDWFARGSAALLPAQRADGSWGDTVNTAFAVLFLKRSNLLRDLSAKVQRDPSAAELRAGEPLVAKPPAEAPKPRPEEPPAPPAEPARPAPAAGQTVPAAPAPSGPRPAQLAADLLAGYGEFDAGLAALRDGKGPEFTAALVGAIGKLDDAKKKAAREALAERLTRMTAGTLREMLGGKEAELRRAAALACGMKDDAAMVPDLIGRLADTDDGVVRTARAALKSLAGGQTDFGPKTGDSDADRNVAVARWREWWATRK